MFSTEKATSGLQMRSLEIAMTMQIIHLDLLSGEAKVDAATSFELMKLQFVWKHADRWKAWGDFKE